MGDDRLNRELAAKGEGDFDSTVLKMNKRAQFIPGPIPTDKIDDGTHTPQAMEDLMVEVLGRPPKED